jgi:pyruvate/2-oxoglutarate dehydrogenase complex dihydrolipoamide dehydrogenase (E3) component
MCRSARIGVCQSGQRLNRLPLHRGMRATISGDEGKGFLKLIVAKDTDKLVGAHFVGSEVAEIMQVGTHPVVRRT